MPTKKITKSFSKQMEEIRASALRLQRDAHLYSSETVKRVSNQLRKRLQLLKADYKENRDLYDLIDRYYSRPSKREIR